MLADIWRFIEDKGQFWITLPETAKKAAQAVTECMEAIHLQNKIKKAKLSISFDEFSLIVHLRYKGKKLDLNACKPDRTEIESDPTALANLSIILMQKHADKVTLSKQGKEQIVTILVKQ